MKPEEKGSPSKENHMQLEMAEERLIREQKEAEEEKKRERSEKK